jgi:hypothetical protein
MTFRTLSTPLSVLSIVLLLGCSSDGATASEFEEDTGSGFIPGDVLDETATDTGTPPPGDTSMPPADTMMPPMDTPAGDTPSTPTAMKCGAFTCTTGTQECCVIAGIGACVTKGAACAGARWGCTAPSNCGSGQVCCVSGAGGAGGGSCTASGMCPSTTTCTSNADCSGSAKNCVDLGAGIKACSK